VSLRTSIAANYVGAAVVVLAPLLAMPWYLDLLGEGLFGLVAFIGAMQSLLNLLDAGLSQGLVRSVALSRNPQTGAPAQATANLLLACERGYCGTVVVLGAALLLAQPWISATWLQIPPALAAPAQTAVLGAIALFAVQFPGSLYRSALIGLERQTQLNAILVAATIVRHAGAVALMSLQPSIGLYVLWHVLIGLAETVVRAACTWRATGIARRCARWDRHEVAGVFGAVAGLGMASLLGAATAQLDRLYLSHMVPIEAFGQYALASMLALGALQLVYPITQALMPRLIVQQAHGNASGRQLLRAGIGLLALATLGALVYAGFGERLLTLWLRNTATAQAIYPIAGWLLLGTVLNALYGLGYLRWLALGRIRYIVGVQFACVVVCAAVLPWAIQRWGVTGAASGWIAANALGLLAVLLEFHRRHET
jgi:O-antigen/teichoic acid export membrane protein